MRCLKTILLILPLLYGCNQNKFGQNRYGQYDSNKKWLGREIVVPRSVVHIVDSLKLKKSEKRSKFTIFTYYDGDCGVCYLQLAKWPKTMETFSAYDVSFKFVLSGNSGAVLKANLEDIGFPLEDVLHDVENEFGNKYGFLLERGYANASMLLDRDNAILCIGNPTISSAVKDKFVKLIKG